MNAICHRDLYEEGATVMVEVYDDRVEISNPGGLLPIVAENFGEKSMSRNPLIFGLFTRMQLVEKVGSGIPRMRRLMKEAELPEPMFNTKGFFTVTFMKRKKVYSTNDGIINDRLNDRLSIRDNQVLQILIDSPGLRTKELASLVGVSIPTMSRTLKSLIDFGLIVYRGSKKTGGYYVLQ